MILTCPSCTARFLVDEAAFGRAARRVRCGKCKHEWQAEPPTPSSSATITPPPLVATPIPPGSNLPAMPKPALPLKRITTAMMVLVGLALGGWLLLSATLGTFGLFSPSTPFADLALSDVKTRYTESNGGYALVVEGNITNTGDEPIAVSTVRVDIKAPSGAALNTGAASVQRPKLDSRDVTSFVYIIDPAPDNISDITVEFTDIPPNAMGADAATPAP